MRDHGNGAAALDVVVDLVRAAADGGLLDDVGALTRGLTDRRWQRYRRGGVWWLAHPVELSAWTSLTPPTVSVHLGYPDDDDAHAALTDVVARLEAVLGEPPQRDGSHEPDQYSAWWGADRETGLHVSATLNPSTSSLVGTAHGSPSEAWLHVQAVQGSTAQEAEELDAERARRVVRDGSAVERWYLAGQRVLPPDVVAALEDDDDPLVARAVRGHAHVRAAVAGQL